MDAWLSPARYDVYLNETGRDRARALELHQWNSELSCAVLRDLAHFEVAPPNAHAAALDATWIGVGHWLDDPSSPLRDELTRTRRGGPRGRRQADQ